MFVYDFGRLDTFLRGLLIKNLTPGAWEWLDNEIRSMKGEPGNAKFNIAFVAMPRKTGRNLVQITEKESMDLDALRSGFKISRWTTERLSRVWLLIQLDPRDSEKYHATIENLFLNAEMSELVALYSSLPLLAYPESWRKRCAEGIRSNIGQVLEAVICNNPFPSEQLDETAWNQLVLKAIFTEKPVLEIIGLRKRMNINLANSLTDYAHERWAAHRDVNPLLWMCLAPFIDDRNFSDIERLFASSHTLDREAAALACHESSYEPAKRLLEKHEDLKMAVESSAITWEGIASKMAL